METKGASVRRNSVWGSDRTRVGRRRKRRRKRCAERIIDWSRTLIAFLFSNVGIVCLVVGYTIGGAFLFTYIEGNYTTEVRTDVGRLRNVTATNLWEFTTVKICSEEIWKSKVSDILKDYQNQVVTVIISEGYDGTNEIKQWTFAGAFLYSLTVITTIGYGNISPRSEWGKIVTMIYAIIGMPLFLLYLSNIGNIFASSFKWIYARCCLCRCWRVPRRAVNVHTTRTRQAFLTKRNSWQMVNVYAGEVDISSIDSRISDEAPENHEEEEEEEYDDNDSKYDPQRVTVPLTLCLAIMVGYIYSGAILFSEWEDWNIVDGSYFCFISLSTIGFGDIVPGDKIYSAKGLELTFIFCSMYLMLGMALIAMCFNLMQEEVIAKTRAIARAIKYIFRCNR